ncbi:MAG: YeeE/YedE family protein [Planctomycetota bacterium]|jgi:uncharacterized membrane protein YedE/YeeE
MDLFPNGIAPYVWGGVVLGAGISLIYVMTGGVAGISSFLTSIQSLWSRRAYFNASWVRTDRAWKPVLVLGLLIGAGLWALVEGAPYVTTVQPWRLVLGGLFVGFGTRMARGCTSGHGICGISAASLPSLASTITFLATAIATAYIVALCGVTP